MVMSALRSVGAGIQTPAVNAVISQIVPKEELMRYNGINAAMQSLVQFAAPAAAGILLSLGSLRDTLLVDVITAAVGIGIVLCLPFSKGTGAFGLYPGKQGLRILFWRISERESGMLLLNSGIGKLLTIYGGFVFLSVPAGYLAGPSGQPRVWKRIWISDSSRSDRIRRNGAGRSDHECPRQPEQTQAKRRQR